MAFTGTPRTSWPWRQIPPPHYSRLFGSGPTLLQMWEPYLAQHLDQEYANFFKRGIQGGFKVVFDRCHPFCPHKRNNESAFKNQAAAQSYIAEEKALGTSCISHKTLQLIGVLSDLPDKFCLIIDLSSPSGASVNNGIDSELMSSTYSSAANWD